MLRVIAAFLSSLVLTLRLRNQTRKRREAEVAVAEAAKNYATRVEAHEIDLRIHRDGPSAADLERMRKYQRQE